MESKVTYRIATEMYCFVEVVEEGTSDPESVQRRYKELTEAFKPRPENELPLKDYNAFVDRMLLGEDGNHIEQYEAMSPEQQRSVQVIKRSLKRLQAKENK